MLARTFKTAHQLKIKDWEYEGLVRLLDLMETDKLIHDKDGMGVGEEEMGFSMGTIRTKAGPDCGTVCCIGGWIATLNHMTQDETEMYVETKHSDCLYELFWGNTANYVSPKIAARVVRHFLTTGEVDWDA